VYEMIYATRTAEVGTHPAADSSTKAGLSCRVFPADEQHGRYYTPEGNSVRKAFLRSPLNIHVYFRFFTTRAPPVLQNAFPKVWISPPDAPK